MARKKTFESALKELEDIVRQMESGELPLEDALKKYELGMKQSRYCLDLLDKIEKKITVLTRDQDGNISEEPLKDI